MCEAVRSISGTLRGRFSRAIVARSIGMPGVWINLDSVSWRNSKPHLGVTESELVRLLRLGNFEGEVDALAAAIGQTPARTWVASARLAERGLVYAEAGNEIGEIRIRFTPQAERRLAGMVLASSDRLRHARPLRTESA